MQAESYKSTLSHELRTPLETSILVMKEIINFFNDTDNNVRINAYLQQTFEQILTQLQFMSCFIEDLLNLQQIKMGSINLENQPFELIEVFNFVTEMFKIKAKAYGVTVSVET